MTATEREAAWWPLHAALPQGWTLGQPTDDPLAQLWRISAMSPRPSWTIPLTTPGFLGATHEMSAPSAPPAA